MKRFILLAIAITNCCALFAQRTVDPVVGKYPKRYPISYVDITNKETKIAITIDAKTHAFEWAPDWVLISSKTTLTANIGGVKRSIPIKELRCVNCTDQNLELDKKYYVFNGAMWELVFDKLPAGVEYINSIQENISNGFEWYGIYIDNPIPSVPHKDLSESQIRKRILDNNDGICGIYEVSDNKLACIKENGQYYVLYLNGSSSKFATWKLGDVKAELHESATKGIFKATWYLADKTKSENVYVTFDGVFMSLLEDNEQLKFLKMFPSSSNDNNSSNNNNNSSNNSNQASSWTGTGWALKNGYIVTNHHVINGAKTIKVSGIKGNFNIEYNARVEATDANNDLAIIKIDDNRFKGFGAIPYKVKTQLADVGEDVFVLGYPMTTTMGDEIKLTNGIISARTGFQNDATLYQISAPIQPGNSGGPLFDSKGNIIGIVNAHHKGAENVSYAIKTSYLSLLADNTSSTPLLPTNNTIANLSLAEKVKRVKNFVFFISCSNKDGIENTKPSTKSIIGNESANSAKSATETTQKQFDWIGVFSDGVALVKKGNKYGYVNEKMELVIGFQFDEAFSFVDGVADVYSMGRWYKIDKTGKVVK